MTRKKLAEMLGVSQAVLGGNILDVGVCVENSDNDRFWCHFSSKSIEVLVRRYRRYQEYLASDREEMHV